MIKSDEICKKICTIQKKVVLLPRITRSICIRTVRKHIIINSFNN